MAAKRPSDIDIHPRSPGRWEYAEDAMRRAEAFHALFMEQMRASYPNLPFVDLLAVFHGEPIAG